uniref:Small glutamine-rich tetratricopeptide repeat-containing protein alpha n=1 Tax=Sander lucioperca TaxID=283035 RepID=A0A8D0ADX6_SANLU
MTDNKRLAFSILQFLHDQLQAGSLTSSAEESLEVAVQCLETAFEISTDDQTLAVPMTLPEIFATATAKVQTIRPSSLSEEQREEAEALKSDGNDQMKVENFSVAVEFYSKAIAINPQNAVYYCNRAAAYSKLGNYAGAVQDCEQAICIDPNYSKAYGRMGLALASLNKHTEAASYYRKALALDPDNDTYKSNLKVAEEKMETSSPTAGMGGVDLGGLLSNPGFMNMVRASVSSSVGSYLTQDEILMLLSLSHVLVSLPVLPVGQQFAQQMQQQNPELIEQLRSQIRNRTPSAGNEEQP